MLWLGLIFYTPQQSTKQLFQRSFLQASGWISTLAFGDYCEVYDGTDNTSRSRTVPCIALHPCNNATGSWTFYNLHTNVRIRRSQWTKLPTTQLIVDVVNAIDPDSPPNVLDVIQPVGEQPAITASPEVTPPAVPADTVPDAVPPVENPIAAPSDNPPEAAEVPVGDDAAVPELVEEVVDDDDGDLPALEPQTADDESDDEADDDDDDDDDDEVEEVPPGRSERPRRDRRPPARYALATKIHTGS